jgi:DNA-directed RNA polymerase II subunit RPB2
MSKVDSKYLEDSDELEDIEDREVLGQELIKPISKGKHKSKEDAYSIELAHSKALNIPDAISWGIIDKYFKNNPYNLVAHHLNSYNEFFNKDIFQIFKENNPIRFIERDESENIDSDKRNQCFLYLGGKDGTRLYFGKPVIYDSNSISGEAYPHYMYPNDARLRNMTYGVSIHYDVEVDFIYYNGDERLETSIMLDKIYLGRFPIMVQSNLCILKGLVSEVRFNLGECRNDYGGYFIIDGKEKCIVSQEKFGNNMLYVRKNGVDDLYSYSCEVRSVSEDSSKPIRYTSVKIIAPDASYTNNQIVVDIPNVKKPVPLFILMRALGVVSDKDIIKYCLLDLENNSNMIDWFIPSIHDANTIFNQQNALEFISLLTKRKTISSVLEILMNYFLPHIGEDNFLNKAYYIGFMVKKLLNVAIGYEAPTDRDNFKFKRVDVSGTLIYELFREYFLIQTKNIFLKIDKEFYYHPGKYRSNFVSLIQDNYKEVFKDRIVEDGFKKGFKGNWGATEHTKKLGLVQDLNRLSWFTFMSHLRKISLPLDPTAKVTGPHKLHCSQWGIIDPLDTPDGGNVGLHKHMAISCAISNQYSSQPLIQWIRSNISSFQLLLECSSETLYYKTKVFVNGNWIGIMSDPIENVNRLKLFRRNGVIPLYTSISFSYEQNIVYLYTDNGRLTRPIYYRDVDGKISYQHGTIKDILESHQYTWEQITTGFEKKGDPNFSIQANILYDTTLLYPGYETLDSLMSMMEKNKGILDYVDTSEEESSFIANYPYQFKENKFYTHSEIDPSLMFGVMGNSIIYPEANPLPRNVFSCGQSKQAVSVYHSNYQMRLDKMGVILNYGQTPLIKSKYLEYINQEEQPYGVNTIVAIMSYTGYNVEDAILINEGSIKRGLFNTTYYTSYETREESSKVSGGTVNSFFANVESKRNVKRLKEGFDYSQLDEHGLIKENTSINDRVILIGQLSSSTDLRGEYLDNSVTTKKGQLGFVDKSFISEGEEGFRIAKVRVREERIPALGDKMACALPTQQVLTNKGWIEIQYIDPSIHKVATIDKEGNLLYEYPTEKFTYDYAGSMYQALNKHVHIICTPNHKLYAKIIQNTKNDEEITKREFSYELIQAIDAVGLEKKVLHKIKNKNDYSSTIMFNNVTYQLSYWLSLYGILYSERNLTDFKHNLTTIKVYSYNKHKITQNLLEIFEIDYNYDETTKTIIILDTILINSLFYNISSYFPQFIWNLSKKQATILLQHILFDNIYGISTNDLTVANQFTRLIVHCELTSCIRLDKTTPYIYYYVKIIKHNETLILPTDEYVMQYEGQVYCIEMPTSHTYYMRETSYSIPILIGNSRAGQKGTLGLVIPEADMPFTPDGIRPDIIINPHALPSRMTIGQLVEGLFGKACASYGSFGDCTAYATKGANYATYGKMLTNVGFHSSGNQILYNGYSGEQLYSEIFIGPTYYMRLKHMVKDKINYRATGKRSALTRQTNQGRSNDGGLKIGEMERDGIMANGLSYFLNESYMVRGDQYWMAICNKTGAIAIYNKERNLFLSPLADGPLVFNKNVEGEPILEAISKYGRSFSIVRIPYAFKLLIQELQVMNIQTRIITESNIDQLLNLSYQSQNINRLLHLPETDGEVIRREVYDIINNYKTQLDRDVKQKPNPNKVFMNDPFTRFEPNSPQSFEISPDFAPPSSPDFAPPSSPDFAPSSPDFAPAGNTSSPEELALLYPSGSPEFSFQNTGIPDSPDYAPAGSPQFTLTSPTPNGATTNSPNFVMSGGGIKNNGIKSVQNVLNKLSSEKLVSLLNLDDTTRSYVISQILSKVQTGGSSNSKLSGVFNSLSTSDQIEALKNIYDSKMVALNNLQNVQNSSNAEIVTNPPSITETMYGGKLNILKTTLEGPKVSNDDYSDSLVMSGGNSEKNESNMSSSSSSSSSISSSGIKSITLK